MGKLFRDRALQRVLRPRSRLGREENPASSGVIPESAGLRLEELE